MIYLRLLLRLYLHNKLMQGTEWLVHEWALTKGSQVKETVVPWQPQGVKNGKKHKKRRRRREYDQQVKDAVCC